MFDDSVKCVAPHVAADWERRMIAGFGDLAGETAERIEAALTFWLEDGSASLGRAVSWCRVVSHALSALGDDASPEAARLRRMGRFADGLRHHGPRIHLSYHDRLRAAARGETPGLRSEIELEAVRIGRQDGFASDPAEAYHAALLTWLLKEGHDCTRRKLMSHRAVGRLHDAISAGGHRGRRVRARTTSRSPESVELRAGA